MTPTRIEGVFAWEALDSRGRPTVACRVRLVGGAEGRAVVPSGASTGSHEALELRDRNDRFGGFGVSNAVCNLNEVLAPAVTGMDASDRAGVDAAIEELDGTSDLGRLGANSVLAVSVAVTVAGAAGLGYPLWKVLDGGDSPLLPLPMVNIVSGGAHARGGLDIQDVLVVPVGAGSFAQAIEWAWRARSATAELLDDRGGSSALVADEGGLAGGLATNESALALVTEGIGRAGLVPGEQVALAIDIAANQNLRRHLIQARSRRPRLWPGRVAVRAGGLVRAVPRCLIGRRARRRRLGELAPSQRHDGRRASAGWRRPFCLAARAVPAGVSRKRGQRCPGQAQSGGDN